MESREFDVSTLRIASPCRMAWSQMEGDSKVRFCGACQTNVYNLSAMTRQEIAELTRNGTQGACMRMYRRADGTVLTRDCPIGKRIRDRFALTVGAVAAAVVGLGAALISFSGDRRVVAEEGPSVETRGRKKHLLPRSEKMMSTGFGAPVTPTPE